MAELEFGLEEVGLRPLHGLLVELVVQQRVDRGPGDAGAARERGLVLLRTSESESRT